MSDKLHVGLVGPLPPPNGGMANQTRQLSELLESDGYQVSLVQVNSPYRPAWVAQVPVLRALARLLPYLADLWRVCGRCDVLHVMANSGWSWHLFATPAIVIAHLRRVPVVVNYRGGEAEAFLVRSGRIVRRVMRLTALLVVPSGFLRDVFARHGMVAEVVPNIVNLDRFSNPQQYRGPRRHLLVTRNLEPIYDNETAIRALSIVRRTHGDAVMTIAGSGPLEESLKSIATSLGVASAVSFTGRLEPSAMAGLYRRAHIAVNPSLVDNMPNSVLEAMASGLPIVSTSVGGVPYIVRDGETALLVSPGVPEEMANAILRLIGDSALCDRLIGNALDDVRAYAWDRVQPMWAGIYRKATLTNSGVRGKL